MGLEFRGRTGIVPIVEQGCIAALPLGFHRGRTVRGRTSAQGPGLNNV